MPITWPRRYAPERTAAHVRNEITIAAPAPIVWAWLVQASSWPDWYPNSSDVRITGGGAHLVAGTDFTWRTFGVTVKCHVAEFEPCARIAWEGTGLLINVYHAWLITPREGACHVLTEESQNGLAAWAQATFMPRRMFNGHALWLERLKAKAESGPPA